jgi:hypothetical protein
MAGMRLLVAASCLGSLLAQAPLDWLPEHEQP